MYIVVYIDLHRQNEEVATYAELYNIARTISGTYTLYV